MISSNELKSIGLSTALVVLNVALMWLFVGTPLATISSIVFSSLILGVLFYGAFLTGGVYLAKRGIRHDNLGLAAIGVGLLEFAYGAFGAGVLSLVSPGAQPVVLGITFAVTAGITVLSGLVVYGTDHNFARWSYYSNILFIGVLVTAFIGTFVPFLALFAFLLALAGFLTYLVYQIWVLKEESHRVYLNAVGIYVAFTGVFVEILQLVARMYAEE